MNLTEDSPTTPEIKAQLERMLASERFRNAKNQSGFLRHVVDRALPGKKTSETIRGKALLGHKYMKGCESMHVRVTADNLRHRSKNITPRRDVKTSVGIALPDPSKDKTIRLPEGEAYTADVRV